MTHVYVYEIHVQWCSGVVAFERDVNPDLLTRLNRSSWLKCCNQIFHNKKGKVSALNMYTFTVQTDKIPGSILS